MVKTPIECVCLNCKNKSIKRSHTISKGISLELIQEKREVCTPVFTTKYVDDQGFIGIEKVGINEASAFPGFCIEHELLFSDFEVDGNFDAKMHICKQTYRNLCRNIVLKQVNYKALQNSVREYENLRNENVRRIISKYETVHNIVVKGSDYYLENIQLQMNQLFNEIRMAKHFKNTLWEDICGRETEISFLIWELNHIVPVAVCGITDIRIEDINYMVAIDVIPLDRRTILSISCGNEMPVALKECLEEQISSAVDFINLIKSIMVYGTDQWYIKPSVWNKIEETRKKAILREMMVIDIPFFQEAKVSIFDDIRKFLIEGMKENNVSKDIIEKEIAKLKYNKCSDYSFLLAKIRNLYENVSL